MTKYALEREEWSEFFVASFLIFLAALPAILFASNGSLPSVWLREDGIYESVAAVACIITALALFWTGIKTAHTNKLVLFWLMSFSFTLFFLGGEEISWGQRLIGFDTPESIANVNYQNEFNVHNLTLIQDHNNQISVYLAKLLVLYLVMFPLFLNAFPTAFKAFNYTRIPIPTLSIALTALTAQIISMQTLRLIYGSVEVVDKLSIGEARESIVELCLCWVAWSYIYYNRKNNTVSASAGSAA